MSFHLFEATGIELEYMIVSRDDLSVLPISDRLLQAANAASPRVSDEEPPDEALFGETGWSNELVLHVIEMKTAHPTRDFAAAGQSFVASVKEASRLLEPMGAMLLGTSAHPWMEPDRETRLWPHGSKEIYEAYDRIFGCRGHGWSNLQSMHINLPFANDEEFGRLHGAVRAVLPLLSALCASSPIIDGRLSGLIDTRLEFYRTNQARLPLIAGSIVPEAVFTMDDYQEKILQPIYKQLAPYDKEGTLQDEWVNSRGAIARFDRMAIEIRTMDIQECPGMDLAAGEAVVRLVRALAEERFASIKTLQSLDTESLALLFLESIKTGGDTYIDDPVLLQVLGAKRPDTVRSLWKGLLPALFPLSSPSSSGTFAPPSSPDTRPGSRDQTPGLLEFILDRGNLSERILRELGRRGQSLLPGTSIPRSLLTDLYRELGDCLAANQPFGLDRIDTAQTRKGDSTSRQ